MSTVSEPTAVRPRPAPRLMLPPVPPAPSARARTWSRLSWLLGLALLTASLVGASHVLQSRQTESPPQAKPSAERPAANGHGVYCLGNVAVDGDVPPDGVALAPTQQGEVTELLIYAGQNVKAGDILLRVKDDLFQKKVVEAELGVRVAELDVAEARRGLDQHRQGVEAQRAAIRAAQHKVASAEATLNRLKNLKETFGQSNNDDIKAADESLAAARDGVEAEEANLRRLEASRPDLKVDKAERGVEVAKARLDEARLLLDNCTLKAPTDGTILRLNVTKGSLITSQTRLPPVQFAPAGPRVVRAEVPQEFAHRVQVGMPALVHDVTIPDFTWQGTVKSLAPAYLPKRTAGTEVLSLSGSDAWVLECIVELAPSGTSPRLNQRVRVGIGTQRSP